MSGWVLDPDAPQRRFIVEILGDGISLAIMRADMHVAQLRDEGQGDGCYGFAIAPDPRFACIHYELLVANSDRVVAQCRGSVGAMPTVFASGAVRWRGGLRLSGTLNEHAGCKLQVYEGSRPLDASLVLYPGESRDGGGRQFDLMLSTALADGQLHRLRVVTANGAELEGSPVSVLVHPRGFGANESGFDALARDFLDRLVPASLPFERYRAWSDAFADDPVFADVPSGFALGVVILGRVGSEATLDSLRIQRGAFATRVVILDSEGAGSSAFSGAEWRDALGAFAVAPVSATLVIRAGTILRPFACQAVSQAFAHSDPEGGRLMLCVGDYEVAELEGIGLPFFGPAFDYERLLSQGYAEGVFAVRDLPEIEGAGDDNLSGYDILFAALEAAQAQGGRIVQVPRILAAAQRPDPAAAGASLAAAVCRHLARSGQVATVEAGEGSVLPLVHVRRPRPEGEVAIIIPTRDRLDLLEPCLTSIGERTHHPDHRIVIVDNGSREQETLDYLALLARRGVTVLRDAGSFNYARLNNLAIREVASPFACLLNNDVEVQKADWLAGMQSFFSRDRVGAVGAKLVWPNGMLQHGGVVLGMNFGAGHAYDRYLANDPGYADGVLAARECSALTAACLLLRREDFLAVGGFDERAFPVAFNDVDLCLKLREAGKTLVWSPSAQLLHRESASRAHDCDSPAKQARLEKELAELRRRWGDQLMADEYYNPNLNLDAYAFTGLALPPRDRRFRVRPVRF